MVKPKKHLGQHFLKDENIARKIADALPESTTRLAEIGPGTGVLTKHLLKKFPEILLLEIDTESVAYLRSAYPDHASKIIHTDVLEVNPSGLFQNKSFTVIGNFPYNISSQILFFVLENYQYIDAVVGMFQKEVAERILSPHNSRKYGILSVLIQLYFNTEYLFTVSEHVFFPPPKVKSSVIRLQKKTMDVQPYDFKFLSRVVKTAFGMRRKTLKNAFGKSSFGDIELPQQFADKRAEQLSPLDFTELTGFLYSQQQKNRR